MISNPREDGRSVLKSKKIDFHGPILVMGVTIYRDEVEVSLTTSYTKTMNIALNIVVKI